MLGVIKEPLDQIPSPVKIRTEAECLLIFSLRLVGFDPKQTSISTRKPDTLKVTLGTQSDRGEPERWSEKVF
jgi:hypothetical protein